MKRGRKLSVFVAVTLILISTLSLTAFAGTWQQDNNGWWYQNDDGSYPVNSWMYDGAWYHFDNNGYMQTGWLNDGGSWYYLDIGSGKMRTEWLQINNKWYYFYDSGVMATGVQYIDGEYYFFAQSGELQNSNDEFSMELGTFSYYYTEYGPFVEVDCYMANYTDRTASVVLDDFRLFSHGNLFAEKSFGELEDFYLYPYSNDVITLVFTPDDIYADEYTLRNIDSVDWKCHWETHYN